MMKIFRKYTSPVDFFLNSWFLFLVPAAIFYGIYYLIPIPLSFYYSFFRMSTVSEMSFVGISNWSRILGDTVFWSSFGNNISLAITSLAIQIPFSLGLALLLRSKMKGTKVLRVIYFVPMLFSATAIGITWQYILGTSFGPLNVFLESIGLHNLTRAWLSEYSMLSFVVVYCWNMIPFYMIILSSALGNIPTSYYEAASIDGANSLQSFIYITLPSLKETLLMVGILIIINSLQQFALVYVMTQGGPNHSSELMSTYMYKEAFAKQNFGYASTIAFSMFLLIFIIVLTLLRVTGQKNRAGGVL